VVVVNMSAPEQYYAIGNAELLHSAIENIVRNASRYTDAAASVDVSFESGDKSYVLLTNRDHGKGVPENDLERIFQLFHRIAEARDRESGGASLGLAIADGSRPHSLCSPYPGSLLTSLQILTRICNS
jgi:signal transduction histidine kinase